MSTVCARALREAMRKVLEHAGLSDSASIPWDLRGPSGPSDGGPQTYKKQKFREGSQRWANPGGRHREKFALYHQRVREGVTGAELAFWHPFARAGHWAAEAEKKGELPPWKVREQGASVR